MRSVDQIRSYVREYLDLEEEDMGNTLIDAWIREGYRKVIRAARRWPFFESTWTVVTVAGTAEVSLSGTVDEINAIEGPYGQLRKMDEASARDDFNPYSLRPQSGQPIAWTKHASTVRIYPTPDTTYSLRVLGWRAPLDWMADGAGATPDFPEECEDTLLAWVMHRAYTHQDDPELAAAEAQRFAASLNEMVSHHTQDDLGAPGVLGGGRRRPTHFTGERPIPWGS